MGDVTKTRRTMWATTFGTTDLGFADEVAPDLKLMLEPIVVGSMGKVKLGSRYVGLSPDSKVTVDLRETGTLRATLQKLMPWATQTAGALLTLTPPVNVDLYTYAAALVLHPIDKGAVLDEDISLLKACPVNAYNIKRDGQKDDVWRVEFEPYPDRSQFSTTGILVYGSVPATAG